MIESKINHNFFVITGGPGAGKTTLLNELANRKYEIVHEVARELIKEQKELEGEALPWKNKELYKDIMFDRSIKSYEQIEKTRKNNKPIFFDRGFLDTICYSTLILSGIDKRMDDYATKWRYNKTVFVLPPWQEIYATDNERKQDWDEAILTYEKMVETYKRYRYQAIEVPRVGIKNRADFVIKYIERNK